MKKINWWNSIFTNKDFKELSKAYFNKNISQGAVTYKFEKLISKFLDIKYTIAVSNGSSALLMSLICLGINKNHEVIIPNRSWIAPANACNILGAKVVIADTQEDLPILNVEKIINKITKKTKAIIPVHLNGRSSDMLLLKKIAKKNDIYIIEDAAQAFGSKNKFGFLGTQSDLGCFSLSVAKIISSGQGGFIVTNTKKYADKLRLIRTHGVAQVENIEKWKNIGFNFRITDLQSALAIQQLYKFNKNKKHLLKIYKIYRDEISNPNFIHIPVDTNSGEIPVYNEFLVKNRKKAIKILLQNNIITRPFYPDILSADYLFKNNKSTCWERPR